jgi:hypothetical protein
MKPCDELTGHDELLARHRWTVRVRELLGRRRVS